MNSRLGHYFRLGLLLGGMYGFGLAAAMPVGWPRLAAALAWVAWMGLVFAWEWRAQKKG